VTLNGKPLERSYLRDAEIRGGGELRFAMAATPNRKWGTSQAARPFSISTAR
jgi:putative alpha-1,2-mannosidase